MTCVIHNFKIRHASTCTTSRTGTCKSTYARNETSRTCKSTYASITTAYPRTKSTKHAYRDDEQTDGIGKKEHH